MKTYTHFILLLIALFLSCKTPYDLTSSTSALYKVENSAGDSLTAIEMLLRPYRDSLNKNMNEVIGYATGDFIKEKPSGSLGNLVVDAMYDKAKKLNENTINAICNFGGIRIPEIKKGPISVGKIFELLPFENELVIVELNGIILRQWYKLIAENGGWPMFYKLKEEKVFEGANGKVFARVDTLYRQDFFQDTLQSISEIIIMNEPIVDSMHYFIATNDYIANGGDNCDFLKNCKKTPTGILIRNLVIDYIRYCKQMQPSRFAQIIKTAK
jgi:2',3'-cyclic-nucleotide 2'-phosphodiesterase (5'-nucleotidase family)